MSYSRPGSYFRQVGGSAYGPGSNPRTACNECQRKYTVRVPILGAFTDADTAAWQAASVNIYGKTNADETLNWKPSRVYDNKSFLEINTDTVPVNCYYLTLTMDSLNPLFTMMRKEGDSFSNYKIDPTITFRANYGNTSLVPSIYVAFTPLGWQGGFPIGSTPMETDSGFTLTTADFERTITLSTTSYPTVAYWGRLANNRALTGMAYDPSKTKNAFNQLSDALQIVINPIFPQLVNGTGDLGLKKDQVQMYVEIEFTATFINQSLTKSITNYAAWEAANFEAGAAPTPEDSSQKIGGTYAQAFSQSTLRADSKAWKIAKKGDKNARGKTLPIVRSKKLVHNTADAKQRALAELTKGMKDEKLKAKIADDVNGSVVFGSKDSTPEGVSLYMGSSKVRQALVASLTGTDGSKTITDNIAMKYYTCEGVDVLNEDLEGAVEITTCGRLFNNNAIVASTTDTNKPIKAFYDQGIQLFKASETISSRGADAGSVKLADNDQTVAVVVPMSSLQLTQLTGNMANPPRLEVTAQQVIVAPSVEDNAPVSGFDHIDMGDGEAAAAIPSFGEYVSGDEATGYKYNKACARNSIVVDVPDAIEMMGQETVRQYVEMMRNKEEGADSIWSSICNIGSTVLNSISKVISEGNALGSISAVSSKGSLARANKAANAEDAVCAISEAISGPSGAQQAKTAKIIVQDLTGAVQLTEATPADEIAANFANFEGSKYSVAQCTESHAQYIKVSFGCQYSFEGTVFFSPPMTFKNGEKALYVPGEAAINVGTSGLLDYYPGAYLSPDCYVDIYPTVMISRVPPTSENFLRRCVPVGNPADNFIRYTLQPINCTDGGKFVQPTISSIDCDALASPGALNSAFFLKLPAYCYPLNLSNAITVNMNVPIPAQLPGEDGNLVTTAVGDELYVVLAISSRIVAQQKKFNLISVIHSFVSSASLFKETINSDLSVTNDGTPEATQCLFQIAGFCPGNDYTMDAAGNAEASTLSKCINASNISFLVQSCTSFNDTA